MFGTDWDCLIKLRGPASGLGTDAGPEPPALGVGALGVWEEANGARQIAEHRLRICDYAATAGCSACVQVSSKCSLSSAIFMLAALPMFLTLSLDQWRTDGASRSAPSAPAIVLHVTDLERRAIEHDGHVVVILRHARRCSKKSRQVTRVEEQRRAARGNRDPNGD